MTPPAGGRWNCCTFPCFALSGSIEVRSAAALCVKNLLAAQSGVDFWEKYKDSQDPLLIYLNPLRKAKKKVAKRGLCLTLNAPGSQR